MIKQVFWTFIFLVLNFSALWIGGMLMGNPGENSWYSQIKIAPWTPPGWVFGAAWTTVMITFAIFMGALVARISGSVFWSWIGFFFLQWVLNIIWSPLFFQWHQLGLALVVLGALWVVMSLFLLKGFRVAGWYVIAVLPYWTWLLVACSLNAYAYWYN